MPSVFSTYRYPNNVEAKTMPQSTEDERPFSPSKLPAPPAAAVHPIMTQSIEEGPPTRNVVRPPESQVLPAVSQIPYFPFAGAQRPSDAEPDSEEDVDRSMGPVSVVFDQFTLISSNHWNTLDHRLQGAYARA